MIRNRQGFADLTAAVGIMVIALIGALVGAAPALAEEASAGALSGSLVVEGAPTEAEARQAEYEVWLASPEARQERELSQSRFEHLSAAEARALADNHIGGLLDTPDGGPPQLPEGQRVAGFVSPYVVQIDLGSSSTYKGLIDSLAPMAVETGQGSFSAIDLAPQTDGGAFGAVRGLTEARLPKELGEGAQLPGVGVTVTPVDGDGSALASEGVVDGASVFYADSQTDTDTIMKLSTFGVLSDAWLRSDDSPAQLSYKLTLPAGAKLQMATDGSGAVDVVREGAVIAEMPKPSARDWAGYQVPVSVSIAGDVVTLTVERKPGSVLYPVEVDPEFKAVTEGISSRAWVYKEASGGTYRHEQMWMANKGGWRNPGFSENEYAYYGYETKGDSKIYEATFSEAYLWGNWEGLEKTPGSGFAKQWVTLVKPGVEEHTETLAEPEPNHKWIHEATLCGNSTCSAEGGAETNAVHAEVSTLHSSAYLMEHWGSQLEFDWPSGFSYTGEIKKGTIYISEPASTYATVEANGAREIDKAENALEGAWLGPHNGAFEYIARDAGLGVSAAYLKLRGQIAGETTWSKNYLNTSSCAGVQCSAEEKEAFTDASLGGNLPEGDDLLEIEAEDPTPGSSSGEHGTGLSGRLHVDAKPPHNITLSGMHSKENGNKEQEYELGEITAHLKISATDGEGSVESSGVKSIEVEVDEHQEGKANGSCTPGPCTATGEWSINGGELGAGYHTIEVVARDYAGNVATAEFPLIVYSASPMALGPGSVNPESGDFALEATDVNMSGGMGGLSVTRHYDSLNTTEGAEGPLGPQWTIGLNSGSSLEELPDGSVMFVGPEGLVHFAKQEGGGFEPPPGDGNLTLEAKSGEYLLKDAKEGTMTRFTKPEGAEEWLPTVSEGPIATDTTTDEYRTVEVEGKKIVEPKLEVAPHPDAKCQYEKLERGCRALEFEYAKETTAKGEGRTEWGKYNGRLVYVYFVAWNPSAKAMRRFAVAHYNYDSKGRLREEANPGIISEGEPRPLPVIYGYDEEGHVSSVTPPGQQPWILTYGTTTGDQRSGRLSKIYRPPASTVRWTGTPLVNTQVPSLSGTPLVGVRIGVSDGSWTGGPLAYGYQWERCGQEECEPIDGATNPEYTPNTADVGFMLRARVSAINGGGSASAVSATTEVVHQIGEGTFWIGSWNIAITCAGLEGTAKLALSTETSVQLTHSACAVYYSAENKSTRKIYKERLSPVCTVDSIGLSLYLELAHGTGESKEPLVLVEPSGGAPNLIVKGVNCALKGEYTFKGGWLGSLAAVDEKQRTGEVAFGVENRSGMVAQGVTEYEREGKVQTIQLFLGTKSVAYEDLWPLHLESAETGGWAKLGLPEHEPEAQLQAPEPGTTIEYNVPLSGVGAPQNLNEAQVAKWGQKDDPVYATAILPQEHAQGWPASSLAGATTYYMDSQARTVNVAGPSGGIATSEYNEENDVTRSLSAGNRAKALEAGASSAEVAAKLDTQSVYGAETGSLIETKGPEHLVQLKDGEKLQARNTVRYGYDEGAPAGEEYGLVTKTTDAAVASGKEYEPRESTTSYSGQGGLGWKLRQPTSTTTDPSGLKLVHTTIYEPQTGQVLETRSPGSSGAESPHDTVTVYYGALVNEKHPECGEHIEWAGLPCETMPGKQPGTEGLPPLPVTRIEYNIYDEPEKQLETFGSVTRTKTTVFQESGRPIETSLSVSGGGYTPIGSVRDTYNPETGELERQIENNETGETKIRNTYNTLGQLTSYTDAAGNTTSYSYDGYGRLSEVNYDDGKLNGMEAWQRYSYDETTGRLVEIQDSAAGIFKASYDQEGRITSETWPNGMTETLEHNSIGEAIYQKYVKSECSSKCTWFSDELRPSVHGEIMDQTSTLAEMGYTYDNAGRLTEVEEWPAGEHCTVRLYAYDAESNRTSQTTRKPTAEGRCATEGGEAQSHTYDEANRLTDTGIVYDGLGDITSLPAADAGGTAIDSSFYVDGQLASQTQGEHSNSYTLDPEGRTYSSTAYTKGVATATTIDHYAGTSGTPSWTYNETAGIWARQITGFNGLVAVQEGAKEAVLQLSDLQGNIVETASLKTTATEPLTKERSTEFGVPTNEKPAQKYSWLGSSGLETAFPSTGAVAQDGATYVPQIGRALQTTTTSPPIPVDQATQYDTTLAPWNDEVAAAQAAQGSSAYQEAVRKYEEAQEPAGENVPEPEGGGVTEGNLESSEEGAGAGAGGCSGGKACAARSIGCYVKVMLGLTGGNIWGRAWLWCPGGWLLADDKLNVCLESTKSTLTFPSITLAYLNCGATHDGREYHRQLYATREESCAYGWSYQVFAHWWFPSFGPGKTWRWHSAGQPYLCTDLLGETAEVTLEKGIEILGEGIPGE